jgi:archaemetzincin
MSRTAASSSRKNREVTILGYEGYDISQFRDSLESAVILFGLEPNFASDVLVTSDVSELEKERKQRDAAKVILYAKNILKESDENPRYVLLVTRHDLFANKMNFVFGLANRELGVGLLSTLRLSLRDEDVTPSTIKERIFKEAAHEVGHLGGLAHCEHEACLMTFSNTLQQVDQKLPLLCDDCKRKLKTNGR